MTLPAPNAAFHWSREPWGHALRCRPLGACAQHLFTSRQLQLPAEDSWQAALASVEATPRRLLRVKQVHGRAIRVLARGQVPGDASDHRPDADAIVSNEPGLALAVMVADCVPILLCDPVRGAVAAVHAGWRGTCARVVHAAVESLVTCCGCEPAHLVAAIGPSVGPRDYEVGDSLIDAFRAAGHSEAHISRWFIRTDRKLRLDLWSANIQQLIDGGVDANRISLCGLSTVAHPGIFDSYRVDGPRAGRMAAIIVVPEATHAPA